MLSCVYTSLVTKRKIFHRTLNMLGTALWCCDIWRDLSDVICLSSYKRATIIKYAFVTRYYIMYSAACTGFKNTSNFNLFIQLTALCWLPFLAVQELSKKKMPKKKTKSSCLKKINVVSFLCKIIHYLVDFFEILRLTTFNLFKKNTIYWVSC